MSDPHQKWTNLGGKKLPTLKGRPSGVQTHQETLFTSPAVVVENAETEESDSDLKSRRKKTRQSFFQKNKGPQLRKRDFKLKVFSRKNMFEGFSFFQYDQYIVNDSTMQKVVVRDQLIIFMDKVNTLKNEIYDDALTQRVITYIAPEELKGLNMKVEEVMSIMNELIKLLLFDIIDELDNIKLSKSPLEPLQAEDPKSEQDLYVQNSHLVKKVLEHFREGVECYMVLCRQSRSNRVLDDINCYLILQFIERGRFGTGMVLQRLRHLKEKQLLNKKNNTKPAETSNDKPEEGTNGADAKEARPVPQDMLAELLKRKFKKQMIVHQTHESKVDLKKETAAGLMNFQKHFEAGNKKPVPRAVQELEREKERAKEKRSIERAMETMGRLEGMPALTKIDMMQKAIADVIPVHPGHSQPPAPEVRELLTLINLARRPGLPHGEPKVWDVLG